MGFHVPLTSCIFHACKTSTTSLTLPSPAASLGWSLVTLNQSCISLHVLTLGRHFPWGLFSMENPSPSILHGLPPSEKFTSLLLQCSLVSNGADLFNDYNCLQTAWSMNYKLATLFSLPDCRVFILLFFYLLLSLTVNLSTAWCYPILKFPLSNILFHYFPSQPHTSSQNHI